MGRQLVTLREGEVSQLGQQGHVRDAEGRSAGLPLTLNIPPCPQTKKEEKRYKAKSASVTEAAQKFKSTVMGGSTTNFLADLIMNSIKCDDSGSAKRGCSRNLRRTFLCTSISGKIRAKWSRVRFRSLFHQ